MTASGTLLKERSTHRGAGHLEASHNPAPWFDAVTSQPQGEVEAGTRRQLPKRPASEGSRGTRPSAHRWEPTAVGALEVLATFPAFWEWAAQAERNASDPHTPGRKPKCPDYVKTAIAAVSDRYNSMHRTIIELQDTPDWARVRKAFNDNRPKDWDPCPDACPTLSDMKYFNYRTRKAGSEKIRELNELATRLNVETAQMMGMLQTGAQRRSRGPELANCLIGDGSVFKEAAGGGVDDSVGPQIVQNIDRETNNPRGSKPVYTWATDGRYNLMISAQPVPPGPNGSPGGEIPDFLHTVQLVNRFTNGGVHGAIYDSALRGAEIDLLADMGVAAIVYPHAQRNPHGKTKGRKAPGRVEKSKEEGSAVHALPNGRECQHPIIWEGGIPKTRTLDTDGNETLTDLELLDIDVAENSNGTFRWYHMYLIPCIHGDFKHRHRLFPGTNERFKERKQRLQEIEAMSTGPSKVRATKGTASKAPVHGEYQRIVPVNTPEFLFLYGKRNISESMHRYMKRRRVNQHVRGMALQSYYLSAGSLMWNALQWHRMQMESNPPPG